MSLGELGRRLQALPAKRPHRDGPAYFEEATTLHTALLLRGSWRMVGHQKQIERTGIPTVRLQYLRW
jgi:hypothetical protein